MRGTADQRRQQAKHQRRQAGTRPTPGVFGGGRTQDSTPLTGPVERPIPVTQRGDAGQASPLVPPAVGTL